MEKIAEFIDGLPEVPSVLNQPPASMEQLDQALAMLGYKAEWTPDQKTAHLEAYEKQQRQTVAGVYRGNRAERRATASKRNGASRNGRKIQRKSVR